MDNLNYQICNGFINKIDFKVMKCVTSDIKLINAPLSHSYCSNRYLLTFIKELIMKNFIKMNINFIRW